VACTKNSSFEEASNQNSAVKCPICRSLTSLPLGGVDELPRNDALIGVIKVLEQQQEPSHQPCQNCDIPATLFCHSCKSEYCEPCFSQIHSGKVFLFFLGKNSHPHSQ